MAMMTTTNLGQTDLSLTVLDPQPTSADFDAPLPQSTGPKQSLWEMWNQEMPPWVLPVGVGAIALFFFMRKR